MPEAVQFILIFFAGGAAGAALTWGLLRRQRAGPASAAITPSPPAPDEPAGESELATRSRQLLSELETRYQGRTASGSEQTPKRRERRRP
jgi:hypothetical protein